MDTVKEVYFFKYCYRCKHEKKLETDDPCWYCLQRSYAINSRKPIYYEKKEGVKCQSTKKNQKKRK